MCTYVLQYGGGSTSEGLQPDLDWHLLPITSDKLKGCPPVRRDTGPWSRLIGQCWGPPLAVGGTWRKQRTGPSLHKAEGSTHRRLSRSKVTAQQNGEGPVLCIVCVWYVRNIIMCTYKLDISPDSLLSLSLSLSPSCSMYMYLNILVAAGCPVHW